MKTADQRWARIRDLFEQAMDLPVEEREPFVEKNCGEDLKLKKELKRLLKSDVQLSRNPLTEAVGAAMDDTVRDRRRDFVGMVVGPYKLVSILGHGGAGTVYLGERIDRQYSAQVAVKIVETASVHSEVLERFRAERQILARLSHPYIGRLLDAGETGRGVPYLVMEYIHGEPIDRYCDKNKLTVEQRLRLFLKVCEAVQFAHQNLIVHRDLKPGNILVAPDGTPKLLDFGIAKLLDTSDGIAALALTRVNDRVLTPEYASPEQILGKTITTSSDVYALGVVLYELLAGIRPYVITANSQLELERAICVTDPPKPSATIKIDRGADKKGSIHRIAEIRSTIPSRLRKQLTGDVDAIVLRALRKEPEKRYGSVEQLSADLQRYLERQPVIARQGNWLYYSQRFFGRHRFGVAVTVVGIAVLTGFVINTSLQSRRIAAERDRAAQEQQRAELVSGFMLDVFAAADPFAAEGRAITARELLDRAATKIGQELNQQPEVRARLLEAIGTAYYSQGQSGRAIPYLQDAIRLRRGFGLQDDRLNDTLYTLAVALRTNGNFSESDQTFAEVLSRLREQHQQNGPLYAKTLRGIGWLEHTKGNVESAKKYLEQSLDLTRKIYGPRHIEVASLLNELANLMAWKQDLVAAERLAREAVNIYHTTTPESHPDRVSNDAILGSILLKEGKIEEAGPALERALAMQRKIFGNESSRFLTTLSNLSDVRLAQGRLSEAEQFAREALTITEHVFGPQQYQSAYAESTLADVLIAQGKINDAEKEIRNALEIYRSTLPPDHQYIASAEYQLGLALLKSGRLVEAGKELEQSMHRWERSGAPPWRAARSESALGEVLWRSHKQQATQLLKHSYDILASDLGPNDPTTIAARVRLDHATRTGSAERNNSQVHN